MLQPVDRDLRAMALWLCLMPSMALAQSAFPTSAPDTPSPAQGRQLEADYRVMAARCGTPAFEKLFTRQSRAFVAAGWIEKTADPAATEKAIETLRRNPLMLVSNRAACDSRMVELKQVMQERSERLRGHGAKHPAGK